MKEVFFRLSLYFVPALIFLGLTYLVWTREEPPVEKAVITLDQELSALFNSNYETVNSFRLYIDKNKENINVNNCSGILVDLDKNGFFDENKLIENAKIPSNINSTSTTFPKIWYNVCSYSTTKGNLIELIFTSDYLLNNFIQKQNGKDYFPGYRFKSIENKTPYYKKVWAPLDLIITDM